MIGKRIKKLRTQNNLTQKELADFLGLTPKMISFYELGQRMPPSDIILKLADKFNVSTDYLLGRSSFDDLTNEQFSKIASYSINTIIKILTPHKDDLHKRLEKRLQEISSQQSQNEQNGELNDDSIKKLALIATTKIFDDFDKLSRKEQTEILSTFGTTVCVDNNNQLIKVNIPLAENDDKKTLSSVDKTKTDLSTEDLELLKRLKKLSPEKRKAIEILSSDNEQSSIVDK